MSSTTKFDISDLHRRFINTDATVLPKSEKPKAAPVTTEDDEMESLPSQPSGARVLGAKSSVQSYTTYLEGLLSGVNPRWRNWIIRGIFSFIMITVFAKLVSMGPLVISFLILLIQIKCFQEIINIGYIVYKSHNLPWFRTLSWLFLFASNYWLYGESLIHHFGVLMNKNNFLQPFVTYHRMIAFLLYTSGFVGFVLSLKKTYYLKQFTLFGYTHITLMILVTSSHQMIQNICEGMIWFLFPVSLIICNDIMAYMFGFFFGRTPLTKLSPKKTWEGFIGGGISTLIFGFILAGILCQYQFFICPLEYNEEIMGLSTSCIPIPLFQKTTYLMPIPFSFFKRTLVLYPFQLHSLVISLFASSIGPFGGFFASGFKRAFRIKDFADTIPGHGGFVVRQTSLHFNLFCFVLYRIDSIVKSSWHYSSMFISRHLQM
jgi:phosphatidate cytidylyltransferase